MIYSKKNAGKWVASKDGKILATDTSLTAVLRKVKRYRKDDVLLDRVPRTPSSPGNMRFAAGPAWLGVFRLVLACAARRPAATFGCFPARSGSAVRAARPVRS